MMNAAGSAAVMLLGLTGAVLAPLPEAHAQTVHYTMPIAEIEARLRTGDFTIIDWRGSRKPEDRTQRVALEFPDSALIVAKWAGAPSGGARFNNEPRYELAAYEIQKLFLDPSDYVVPPTVIRAFPLTFVAAQVPDQRPTFGQAPLSVVVALQYWLHNVQATDFWHPERVETDSLYALRIANFNIFTHLIGHIDGNIGNFLWSTEEEDPHIFSVDNGVSFGSEPSDRTDEWKFMRVRRLPRSTIERLERLTHEDLEAALGVLIEFQIRDGHLIEVEPGENFSRNRGVRRNDDRIQFGLTAREIREVDSRLRSLVRDAKGSRYKLF
ncbi:MAG TPA: hypothetical protein VK933_12090 [Longimicrobiales bacterium]|nr:hypothetical protein [Longimicrobiales bacterium]